MTKNSSITLNAKGAKKCHELSCANLIFINSDQGGELLIGAVICGLFGVCLLICVECLFCLIPYALLR